jgi:hypothetical protein
MKHKPVLCFFDLGNNLCYWPSLTRMPKMLFKLPKFKHAKMTGFVMLQIYSFSWQISAAKSKITQFSQPVQISKEAAKHLKICPLF